MYSAYVSKYIYLLVIISWNPPAFIMKFYVSLICIITSLYVISIFLESLQVYHMVLKGSTDSLCEVVEM